MGAIKPRKLRRNNSAEMHGVSKSARKSKRQALKFRSKKTYLQSGTLNLLGKSNHPQKKAKKKVLHVKRKCVIGKKFKRRVTMPQDSKEKTDLWTDGSDLSSSEPEQVEPESESRTLNANSPVLTKNCNDSCIITAAGGMNPKSPTPLSSKHQDASLRNVNGERSKDISKAQSSELGMHNMSCLEDRSKSSPYRESAAGELSGQLPLEDGDPIHESLGSLDGSQSYAARCNVKSLRKNNLKTSRSSVSRMKGVSKSQLNPAKRKKSNVMSRRKALHKFYLKNSHCGYRLALKKFRHKKWHKSSKDGAAHVEIMQKNSGADETVPLEVLVKRRLPLSNVTHSMDHDPVIAEQATPVVQKIVKQMMSLPKRPMNQNVVSCRMPHETLFEASPHVVSKNPAPDVESSAKRDVCYIFAILDREKDETLFQCSPELKSHQMLQQIGSLLDTISADDTLLCKKDYPRPKYISRSTSPVSFISKPIDIKQCADACNPSNVSGDLSASNVEGTPAEAKKPSLDKVEDEQKPAMDTVTKVMVSKALLSFTSEVQILTDVSIRLLGWCSGTVKADLDSDSFDDDLEGFLCHCHDKVSILIECLSILDSKQILNLDGAELNRFWLLHDALRCLLQAYRCIHLPSTSPSFRQQLISLMTTCSKMMLPSMKTTISKWAHMMTMISGISSKLCEAELMSTVCLCHQHFMSVRKSRSCQVCSLTDLYQEMCKATELTTTKQIDVEEPATYASTVAVVQRLFPRFYWFLSEVEGLSKEEFMAAFKKHSVVRFSCNEQSRLYPCDEHLSSIVCSCFATWRIEDSLNQGQAGESCLPENVAATQKSKTAENGEQGMPSESSNQETDSTDKTIPQTFLEKDLKNVQSDKKGASKESDLVVQLLESNSCTSSSDTVLCSSHPAKEQEEAICSPLAKETVFENGRLQEESKSQFATESTDCEIITLSEAGSSQDFSLQIELTTETRKLNAQPHVSTQNYQSEECVAQAKSKIETNFCGGPEKLKVPRSNAFLDTSECKGNSFASTVPASSNSSVDYSSLHFVQAQSDIKNAQSDINNALSFVRSYIPHVKAESKTQVGVQKNNSSVSSVSDSQNSIEEVSVAEEDLMRDVSIGDDSVFESSVSNDLEMRELSMYANKNSTDEEASSQEGCRVNTSSVMSSNSQPLGDDAMLKETESCIILSSPDIHSEISISIDQGSSSLTSAEDAELESLGEYHQSAKFNHRNDNNNLKQKMTKETKINENHKLKLPKCANGVSASGSKRESEDGITSQAKVPQQLSCAREKFSSYYVSKLSLKRNKIGVTDVDSDGCNGETTSKSCAPVKRVRFESDVITFVGPCKEDQIAENLREGKHGTIAALNGRQKATSCLKREENNSRGQVKKSVKFAMDLDGEQSEDKRSFLFKNQSDGKVTDSATKSKNEFKKTVENSKLENCEGEDSSIDAKEVGKVLRSKKNMQRNNVDDSELAVDDAADVGGCFQTTMRRKEPREKLKTAQETNQTLHELETGFIAEDMDEKTSRSSRTEKIVSIMRKETPEVISSLQGNGGKKNQSTEGVLRKLKKGNTKLPAEHISEQLADTVKTRRRTKRELEREVAEDSPEEQVLMHNDLGRRAAPANKSNRSKKAKLYQAGNDSSKGDHCGTQNLNVSDPDWKNYLSDLKGRILED